MSAGLLSTADVETSYRRKIICCALGKFKDVA